MTSSNLVGPATGRSAGLRALEDLTGVDGGLTIHVQVIGPIAHQPTGRRIIAIGIDRGNPIARRERRKLDAPADEMPWGR